MAKTAGILRLAKLLVAENDYTALIKTPIFKDQQSSRSGLMEPAARMPARFLAEDSLPQKESDRGK